MTPRAGSTTPSVDFAHGALTVAPNRRFLMHQDGTPFFYLGDTAWELFHRLSRADADRLLQNRAAKRFTVIQAVVLAELNGLTEPNAEGHVPLHECDPTRPNDAYFQLVDDVVQRAAGYGLYIGMLPTWGSWTVQEKHPFLENRCIFTPDNARVYGRWLGARYAGAPNIIWILGGDRAVQDERHLQVLRGMAEGLRAGDGGRHLCTFHPRGGRSSADPLHAEPWLDFNMLQSGHAGRDLPNYQMVAADYARTPVKPCFDGEPRYEDHPVMNATWSSFDGYFDDYDVRKAAYWAVFAGAHGHTYGCHPVWQMYAPPHTPLNNIRRPWYEAIDLPGAGQMQHVRALMESRPFFERIPDQTLLACEPDSGGAHMQAARAADGSYAMIYAPCAAQAIEVRLVHLASTQPRGWWFDPRTGGSTAAVPQCLSADRATYVTPAEGPDWVLVLDDPARGFTAPGARGGR